MPITELTPQRPVSPYGKSKHMSETAIKDMVATHPKMNVAILRYFNVIGSDPDNRVGEVPRRSLSHFGRISAACFQAAKGEREALHIFGTTHDTPDGTCVRDYIHVSDLVSAHVKGRFDLPGYSIRMAVLCIT